jgi:hypothetical protein
VLTNPYNHPLSLANFNDFKHLNLELCCLGKLPIMEKQTTLRGFRMLCFFSICDNCYNVLLIFILFIISGCGVSGNSKDTKSEQTNQKNLLIVIFRL